MNDVGDKMATLFLAIVVSLSSGALIFFMGIGYRLFRWAKTGYRVASPNCLGHLTKKHCEYCSDTCPLAARCALLVMDDYMRRYPGILFSADSTEKH